MANKVIYALQGGKRVWLHSAAETVDFLSVKVGASGLEIKETAGAFDFSAKKLTNLLSGTGAGEALIYDQRVASLDGAGKVPVAQLPSAVMTYEGVWNASTNSPSLADGVGDAGMVYRVSVAGTQDLGSGNISFAVGDYVIYNGAEWEKSASSDAVLSVNGLVGVVVLDTDDIDEGAANFYYTEGRFDASLATKDTDDLAEGSNLYYTAARFNTAFSAKSTTDLAEGSNLYFTNARAIAATLTGFSATTGAVSASDTILQAIQKLYGNSLLFQTDDSAMSKTNDNAGAITIRQVVYIKSDGDVDLAKADAYATCNGKLGIVKDASIASAAAGMIYVKSGTRVAGYSGLTPGAVQYVSPGTAGALTETRPVTVGQSERMLGFALSATEIEFFPSHEAVEVAS
jgi:hypothetical protein